jgi:hypothetical protein
MMPDKAASPKTRVWANLLGPAIAGTRLRALAFPGEDPT